MYIDLVLRADDPERAAQILHALGFKVEAPNRPNADRWHSRISGSISIIASNEGDAGLAIGLPSLYAFRHMLEEIAGRTSGGDIIVDAGGATLRLVEDGGPVLRPYGDRMLMFHAETVLQSARGDLRQVFKEHGIGTPILVGPETFSGGRIEGEAYERRFTMIVEGAMGEAISEINGILIRHAIPDLIVEAVGAAEVEERILAEARRLGWDVHV